jgi:nucleotide-binding universal stress UspA family protein
MMPNIVALVDLDDENSWRKVLPTAIDQAKHTGARLHVLTIVPDGMFRMSVVAQVIPEDYERRIADEANERLAALVQEHAVEGIDVNPVVRLGSVYKEALNFARDNGAELIVMGAHKPGMADYLLGSNASQIVRHAKCSVWVVRE